MKPDETKLVFLSLLSLPPSTSDQATLQIAPIPIVQLWSAFKQFAALPLDGETQGFIFECGIGPKNEHEQEFVLSFRRYFFVPFDDDPELFFQLCFEVGVCYAPNPAFEPRSMWFQVEAETDFAQAAERFIQRVEELHDLWQLLTGRQPTEVYLFQ